MTKRWHWIRLDVLRAIHDKQIAQHGGLTGVRDAGLIESALAHPKNLGHYGHPDAAALAAAYAFQIARNHGFNDGNKRTAWVAARLFLLDNGYTLKFDGFEAVRVMESVAANSITEEDLAEWFRL